VIGTVPAGKVWVLRDVFVWTSAATGLAQLSESTTLVLAFWTSTGANSNFLQSRRVVLNAGETLQFLSTTAGWTVVVSGYELDA
jgi:hypothetical protein